MSGVFLLMAVMGLGWSAGAGEGERSVSVVFKGAESFTEAQLVRALRRYEVPVSGVLSATDADDAAFFVREFYNDRGFLDAEVGYAFDARAGTAVVRIAEGPAMRLGKLRFEGGGVFSVNRLEDVVVASLRRSSRSFLGRLRYVESAQEAACEDLRGLYAREGYLNAQVEFTVSAGARAGEKDVTYEIVEGVICRVRDVMLTGDGEERVEGEIATLLQDLKGQIWTDERAVLARGRLLRLLKNNGHYFAKVDVTPLMNPATGAVDLRIFLERGPVFRIGKVSVSGNKRTFAQAIALRLGAESGEVYDQSRIEAGERRLWFSGAFSDINLAVREVEGDLLDFDLDVEEGAARMIRGVAGYSQWEQLFVNMVYTDRNFVGTMNSLSVDGEYSALGYGGSIRITDPMVLNSANEASVAGFYLRQELPAYEATFYGGVVGLRRQFDSPNLTGWELEYEWRSVTNVRVFGEGAGTRADEADYTVGLLAVSQTLDRRNDILAPMKGHFLNYSVGLASEAIGSEVDFFEVEARAGWWLPLREITPERAFVPFVHFRHEVGWIAPYGGTGLVPTPERFFMGGPESVRSFQLDGMGPRDAGGAPIGGELMWLLSAELQVPIWGSLYGVAFLDTGNLALTPEKYQWAETAVAPGLGARVYTPIGALRIDYGYNLIRQEGDPTGAVLFGFGFAF